MVRPRGYWDSLENQHSFAVNVLAPKYNFALPNSIPDWYLSWYGLKQKHFSDTNGSGLLAGKYGQSPIKFLQSVFPTIDWLPWKMGMVPQGYWNNISNVRKYMDWLMKEMGYTSPEGFYKIRQDDFRKRKGIGLQDKYGNRLLDILRDAYPEIYWLPWKFDKTTQNYFDDIKNQKHFIQYVEEKEGMTDISDWYDYDGNIIKKYGAKGLLQNYYGASIQTLLKKVYPDYDFKSYLFTKTTQGYWDSMDNRRNFIHDFIKHNNFTSYEDLYSIGYYDFKRFRGGGLLRIYNESYISMLKDVIKEFDWDDSKFINYKTEAKLYKFLKRHYPSVLRQFKIETCRNINKLPFDFFIPEHETIIELDGRQHFKETSNWGLPDIKRDIYKMEKAAEFGYKVIRIFQEDVYNNDDKWLDKWLLPEIQSVERVPVFICTSDETLYDEHINLYKGEE